MYAYLFVRCRSALALLCAAVASLCAFAPLSLAAEVTVVTFGGTYRDAARKYLFDGYERASGTKVNDVAYDGDIEKVYAMVKSHDVAWDVIAVEAPELARGCADGVFEQIDWSVVRKEKFIAGGTSSCGAGQALWGAAIFYDAIRTRKGPDSWAKLWDLATYPGKRALRYGPKMTLEIALLADGVAKSDVYKVLATPEGQQRAFAKLDRIKPQIVWWKTAAKPAQMVRSGEATYALGYATSILRANRAGARFALSWTTLLYSLDSWAVLRGSRNAAEGMKMIEWITDAKPLTAMLAEWSISPPNVEVATNARLREKFPGMISNRLDDALFIDTEFWVAHGAQLSARFDAWVAK
jgi:putative spermidine/putrescine transport system substrate-binding protein